jgi:hypothetical protein
MTLEVYLFDILHMILSFFNECASNWSFGSD